ncbi:MAG: cytochrome c-type biogenesis protein CcmH [Gemmatimonadota bacterium]
MKAARLDTRVLAALVLAVALVAVTVVVAKPSALHGATTMQLQPAQEGLVPEAAERAIGGLWSPYCPGQMLEVCTSGAGAAMRDSIMTQARAGMSSEEIVDYWVAQFGEEYRALPEMRGAGNFAWFTPAAVLLLGLLIAGRLIPRRESVPVDVGAVIGAEDRARLETAMAELDRQEAPDF